MKAIFLLGLLVFPFLLPSVTSFLISVNIPGAVDGHIIPLIRYKDGVVTFTSDLSNSGSISYTARARIDIFNDSEIIFTGWTKAATVVPGSSKAFDLYWIPEKGEYTARFRIYAANEIFETNRTFEINQTPEPEYIFEFYDFRSYDDFMRLDIRTTKKVADIIIFPHSIPLGWIVEQKRIDVLDYEQEVIIPYTTDLFKEGDPIILAAITEDGKYFGEQEFVIQKEKGFSRFLNWIYDWLKEIPRRIMGRLSL